MMLVKMIISLPYCSSTGECHLGPTDQGAERRLLSAGQGGCQGRGLPLAASRSLQSNRRRIVSQRARSRKRQEYYADAARLRNHGPISIATKNKMTLSTTI